MSQWRHVHVASINTISIAIVCRLLAPVVNDGQRIGEKKNLLPPQQSLVAAAVHLPGQLGNLPCAHFKKEI